jgi:hypothetical protein
MWPCTVVGDCPPPAPRPWHSWRRWANRKDASKKWLHQNGARCAGREYTQVKIRTTALEH